MTREEQKSVLTRVEELLAGGTSQAQLARMTGINAAILSGLRKGTYAGNTEKYITMLAGYFRQKEAARELTSEALPYAQTSVSQGTYDVIRNCQIKGGLSTVAGDAGIGKTRAALQYRDDNPNSAIYLCLNPCVVSLKSTLRMLAKELGVAEKSADEMWFGILDRLADGTVIILDEAQHLPIRTIEAFRAFSDDFAATGRTLGIVMIGNRETLNRFSGRRQADFAQIANRTKQRKIYSADQVKPEDIRMLFPEVKDAGAISFLHKVATGVEAVRGAVNLYCNAADNDDLSENGLRAMAQFMEIRF